MNRLKLAVAAASLLLSASIIRAQDATPPKSPLVANPVFQSNCARCHTAEGTGHRIGPPSLVSGKIPTRSADEIRGVITNGKGHMPKFGDKLSADEIDTLIQQIKSASTK